MSMTPSNSQELINFLYAVLLAFLFCTFFDFSESVKTFISDRLKKVYDALIWFVLVLFFCLSWQKYLSGEFRWYTVLGFLISMILYRLVLHRPFYLAFCTILKEIYGFFDIILKYVLTAKRFLSKINMYLLEQFKKYYFADDEGKIYEKNKEKI